jgi:signal transduction histidine kinase/FixJ family two-component response regulator
MIVCVLLKGEGLSNFPFFLIPPVAEAYAGWVILRWSLGKRTPLMRSRDAAIFFGAALVSSLVGAVLGVGLSFGGGGGLSGGLSWFFGDLAGILVISPVFLMVFGLPLRRWWKGLKKGALPITFSIGGILFFGYIFEGFERELPFSWEFVTLPVIFLSIWLLGLPGLVFVNFCLYAGTLGHFVFRGSPHLGDPHFSLPQLQAFLVLVAGMGLVLNGFLQEQAGMRRRAELSEQRLRRTLRQLEKELDREVALLQERMSLKDDLRKSKQAEALGKRAGSVIHDYSNMMAALIGHVEQAKRFVGRGENPDEAFEVLSNGLFQAEILGRRILVDSDEESIQVLSISVGDIVREIFQLWRVLLPPGVQAVLEVPDNLPTVSADPVWLRQALLNLLKNAKEAVDPKGQIRVVVSQWNGTLEEGKGHWAFGSGSSFLCILVQDDGVGMEIDVREKVLEPFFSTKGEGHGFGLSSVLQGIEYLGGGMQIDSSPGEGTSIRLLLPQEEPTHLIPSMPLSSKDGVMFERDCQILVIEDDPFIAKLFQRVLEEAGSQVCLAGDWRKGAEILKEKWKEISLVLLDWSLPDVQGSEALSQLRAEYERLPILLASGFRENELSLHLEEVRKGEGGPVGFLAKPFRPQQLLLLVAELIEEENQALHPSSKVKQSGR